MHRIIKMDIGEIVNEYVDDVVIGNLESWITTYNEMEDDLHWCEHDLRYINSEKEDGSRNRGLSKSQVFQKIISNTPMGLQLTARITDNYLQLKSKRKQRRHHKLEEWQDYCDWVETLPWFGYLVLGEDLPKKD